MNDFKPIRSAISASRSIAAALVGTIAVSACDKVINKYTSVAVYDFDATVTGVGRVNSYKDLADRNEKAAAYFVKEESKFYAKPGQLPENCIALSGGGLRSASYGIGVLAALEYHGLLADIDIMSGVSGGGYATSWYVAQHLLGDPVNAGYPANAGGLPPGRLFAWPREADNASVSGRVANAPRRDLLATLDADTSIQSKLEAGVSIAPLAGSAIAGSASFLVAPINLVANGIFGTHSNTSLNHHFYANNLRDSFHGGRSIALGSVAGFLERRAADPNRRLPFPVISATAHVEDNRFHHGGKLPVTVYEVTPLRYGSDGFGYGSSDRLTHDLATVAAISGAAMDNQTELNGNGARILWSLLNMDLGHYIDNPNSDYANLSYQGFLPMGLYYLSPAYQRDRRGFRIYLTDGGHSDNLAAYALVRRICKNITIVDAEHDPSYEFEGYFKLKQGLKRDLGVDLVVSAIDGQRKLFRELGKPRDDGFVAPETETTCNATRRGPLPAHLAARTQIACDFPRKEFVFKGTIGDFPVWSPTARDKLDFRSIDVTYVKLGIEREAPDGRPLRDWLRREYGAQVVGQYYGDSDRDRTAEEMNDSLFPQESTMDQDYSSQQYMAYRDLGFRVMDRYICKEGTSKRPSAC
jgi:hypothetical protein